MLKVDADVALVDAMHGAGDHRDKHGDDRDYRGQDRPELDPRRADGLVLGPMVVTRLGVRHIDPRATPFFGSRLRQELGWDFQRAGGLRLRWGIWIRLTIATKGIYKYLSDLMCKVVAFRNIFS